MGLLDQYRIGGGLFGGHSTPGIGDGIPGNRRMGGFDMGDMQGEIDRYASMPAPEQKRSGVFGSGYSGEDIMSMLLRAAAIAQGDLGAGAQFGANIGAKARAEAEEAARRRASLEDYEAKQQIDQRYAPPAKPPAIVQNLEAFQQFTPEQMQAFERYQALVNPRYMTGADKLPYQTNTAPLDPGEWEPYDPQGGGGGNATGGF